MADGTEVYSGYEEPVSEDCKEYYLFLLEFFVKQVSGVRLRKLNQMFAVPTSVHFSFLDFTEEDNLYVTPVDPLFQAQEGVVDDVEVFNTGKSVLFAIDHESAMNRNAKLILKIIVKKRMPNGIKSDVLVGIGELNLSKEYAALRMEAVEYTRKDMTISKVYDNELELIHNGEVSGYVHVYVRISGYGQMIVTEFDAPLTREPSTFFFSGETDRTLLYKFRKVDPETADLTKDSTEDFQDPTVCPICMPPKQHVCTPCGKLEAVQAYRDKQMEYDRMPERRSKETPSKDRISCSPCRSRDESRELCGKPVVLKVSGLFDSSDSGKKPTVTVTDETAGTDEPIDPDYDVFVLRIGKKGLVGAGEKSDIQLEMKTPKGPERRPPIRYETRDMQTDHEEVEPLKEVRKKKKKK